MITEPWRVLRLRGIPYLLCLVCDQLSCHMEDVNLHQCSYCGIFLQELPEDFRRPGRQVRNMPGWQVEPPANDPQE